MSIPKEKWSLIHQTNKQNDKENVYSSSVIHSNFSSADRNMNRGVSNSSSKTNLIPKDTNISDSRIRNAMDSRDEFQRMYENQKNKRKVQTAELRDQKSKVQKEKDRLDQEVIELKGEVEEVRRKYKLECQKNDVLEKNLQRLENDRLINSQRSRQILENSQITIKVQKLQSQKQHLQNLYKSMKQNYRNLEKQHKQLKYSTLTTIKEQKSIHSIEEKHIQQIRRQWEKDIQQYSEQNKKLAQRQSQLTQALAKSQIKIQIQRDQLEYKNNNMKKMENKIDDLIHKLTENGKCLQQQKKKLKQKQMEHQKILQQMESMFQKQIEKLLKQHKNSEEKIQKRVQSELQNKIQEANIEQQRVIDENLQMIADLQNKNQRWQAQYKKIVDSRDNLQYQLSLNKISMQKLKAELEDNNDEISKEYEEEITKLKGEIDTAKEQLENLQKAHIIQTNKNKELKGLIECYEIKIEETQEISKRDSNLLQSLQEAYNQKEKQYEEEILKLREEIKKRQKQNQAKKAEFECLEMERNQWKNYTNQYTQQFEDLRRQNRKLKKQITDLKDQNLQKIKNSTRKIEQLQQLIKESQNDKKKIISIHQQQISEIKKKLLAEHSEQIANKEKQMVNMEKQIAQNVKKQLQKQYKEANEVQINKLKKKIQEEKTTIVHKYQEKNHDLEKQFQSAKKQSYQTFEEVEAKNKQIKLLLQATTELERKIAREARNNDQLKKQMGYQREKNEQMRKKYEQMKVENEGLLSKMKRYKEEIEENSKKTDKLKQQYDNEMQKLADMNNKVKKMEQKYRKMQKDIEKYREEVSEVEKSKWQLQDKILMLERNNARLQSLKNQMEQELVANSGRTDLNHNSEVQRLNQIIKVKNQEIQTIISAKKLIQNEKIALKESIQSKLYLEEQVKSLKTQNSSLNIQLAQKKGELSVCQQQKQKLYTKMTIIEKQEKQRHSKLQQLQKKERKEVYEKLCAISNQFFSLQFKQSQIQFLTILYHKLRIWVDYTAKLKQEMHKYKSLQHLKEEEFSKTKGKQMQENMGLKEEYDIIYRKYLKYKQAYISCRGKVQKQRHDIVQDQRFTQQIITHCKALIDTNNHKSVSRK